MIQDVEEKADSLSLTLHSQENTCSETALLLTRKPCSVEVKEATKIEEKWLEAEKELYVICKHGARPAKLMVSL
jgi:hypothetical protein